VNTRRLDAGLGITGLVPLRHLFCPWAVRSCIEETRTLVFRPLPASTSQFERAMSDRNAHVRRVAIRRHIQDGRRRIALISGLIAQVASRGGDTTLGERLLATMESALDTLVEIARANGGEVCTVHAQALRLSSAVDARQDCPADESFDPIAADRRGRDVRPGAEAVSSLRSVRAHAWNRRGRVTYAASSSLGLTSTN